MITSKEYTARRKELMSLMHSNSIAIISAAPEKLDREIRIIPISRM